MNKYKKIAITAAVTTSLIHSVSATSIVGSWHVDEVPFAPNAAGGPVVITFMDNGQYTFGQDGDSTVDPSGNDGMEWGTYTYDGTTLNWLNGGLDTNGEWGFGEVNDSGSTQFIITGDQATGGAGMSPNGVAFWERVHVDNSIIGGWQLDGAVNDETVVMTFMAGGDFMLVHGNSPSDDGGQAGIEYGTYNWNDGSDAFSASPITDTTGDFGLFPDTPTSISVSGNTMTATFVIRD